eukprot:TRINITY_DN19638_c0_g1_i2.p1 TRINITY_DN19638_c0_g1~~TRINITY_DN19638_c0_g1_i2.p1  ORF type:complete len:105 (+),score=20.27 TRINITY_DN19638_c0_g1_i2:59-373(+)
MASSLDFSNDAICEHWTPQSGKGNVAARHIEAGEDILLEKSFFMHSVGSYDSCEGLAADFADMVESQCLGNVPLLQKLAKLCGGESLRELLEVAEKTGSAEERF